MSRFYTFLSLFVFITALSTPQAGYAKADFPVFIQQLKGYYADKGISQKTLTQAFQNVKAPIKKIVELDRNQPEFKLTLETYLRRTTPKSRVDKGKHRYTKNKELLEKVALKYQVQPRFIVALWGIETDFGRIQGGFDIVPALVTLIYDGRREKFFKKELHEALRILEEGHVEPQNFKGSWAGAMGQSQFMPSSFNQFAQDGNGDGRKDIWATREDVFASIANYLSQSGWKFDQTWGRKISIPKGFNYLDVKKKTYKSLAEWQRLGVRKVNGKALPSRNLQARVVMPDGRDGAAYIVYNNYDTILKWNRSDYFAVAVGTLADKIGNSYTRVSMQ